MSRVDHVVVTGAAGFIGAALVDAALARGARVTAIDRRPGPRREGVEHVVLDLADARCDPTLGAALRGADVVFHLAGLPGVRDRRPGVELARWRDNVIAGRVVLGATPLAVPVVVTSSSSVYGGARAGPGGATRPSHEGDPPAPRGGYARSKVALEALCAARRRAGGAITVVRPFTVAGEGQRADMGIARWLDACAHDQPVVVLGSLERTRDVTDVRDVVRGLWSAAACAADGRAPVVNLGTGRPWSLARILAAVEHAVGRRATVRLRAASSDEPDATRADTTRCAAELGFVPSTDLDATVARQWARQSAVDAPDVYAGTTYMSWATSRGTSCSPASLSR